MSNQSGIPRRMLAAPPPGGPKSKPPAPPGGPKRKPAPPPPPVKRKAPTSAPMGKVEPQGTPAGGVPVKPKPSAPAAPLKKPAKPAPASTGTPVSRPVSGLGGLAAGAAAGAALSEDLLARVNTVDTKLRGLYDGVSFTSERRALEDLGAGIGALVEQTARIRERGYVYKSYIERKVETLVAKWGEAEPSARYALDQAEYELTPGYNALAEQLNSLVSTGRATAGQVQGLESGLSDLETRVSTSKSNAYLLYKDVSQTYYQTKAQIDQIVWLLDQLDHSSFELLAGENAIQAVEGKWWRDGDDEGPQGILYLTDQRLLFEQKEKVAKKKVLFITTESELVQQLVMANPIGAVESVKASSRGLGGHEDHLDLAFSSGDWVNAHFHLKGQDSEEWAALVKRVLNGDIQRERYSTGGEVPAGGAQDVEQTLAQAPTKCNACGAPIDEQIVRGQRQVQCEYCGTVMRW